MDTGYASIDTTVDKTNRVLNEIEEANGWTRDERQHSYAALRSVLHAVRDRLSVHQSAHLSAQLPVLLKGIYYDGWRPSSVPQRMHRDDFDARVRRELAFLGDDGDVEAVVRSVIHAVRRHITEGEWNKVTDTLPEDLADLLA